MNNEVKLSSKIKHNLGTFPASKLFENDIKVISEYLFDFFNLIWLQERLLSEYKRYGCFYFAT